MSEEAHSSLVGGSSAERRIACPGSWQLEQKLPPSSKKESSVYADEGTALHECMTYLLTEPDKGLDDILGMTFGVSETSPSGFVMTQELVDEAIAPCLDFFDALADELTESDGDFEYLVENRVEMPGIPDSFGTADVLFRTPKRSGNIDWKFGVGVRVMASYPDPEHKLGRRPNKQQSYYCRGGMHTFPHMFERSPAWPVDLYIVQPRSRELEEEDDIFTMCSTTVGELEDFRGELIRAVAEAKGSDPRIQIGPHCKFAACKVICPAHLEPKLDIVKLQGALAARRAGKEVEKRDWTVEFGWLLEAADIAEDVIGEIRTQAHAFLEGGGRIEGWHLVDKRSSFTYTDAEGAKRHAMSIGLTEEQVFEPQTLRSAPQLRDEIGKHLGGKNAAERKAKALEELKPFTADVSSGTTLAPVGDKRPAAVITATQLNELGNKIKALTGR